MVSRSVEIAQMTQLPYVHDCKFSPTQNLQSQNSRMLNPTTSKSSIIRLAKAMKRCYLEDPLTYYRSGPFRQMQQVLEEVTLDNFVIPYFPKKVSEGQIYTEDKLRVSLFFVPKGTEMPLHDHPGMFVLCKILKGRLMRDAYRLHSNQWQLTFPKSFMRGEFSHREMPSVMATKSSQEVRENDIDIVTPEINLHRFLALEDSIFFDVISPDYDQKEVFLNYYDEKRRTSNPGEVELIMKPLRKKQVSNINVELLS